jgi:hypothetical protein
MQLDDIKRKLAKYEVIVDIRNGLLYLGDWRDTQVVEQDNNFKLTDKYHFYETADKSENAVNKVILEIIGEEK